MVGMPDQTASVVSARKRVCAFDGCDVAFTPQRLGQLYHNAACREANARAQRRLRARTKPTTPPVDPYAAPPALLGVVHELEQRTTSGRRPESAAEALLAGVMASDAAVLTLLKRTLLKVRAADADGDRAVLRDELLDLGALAADFAARQPRPVRRRAQAA